MSYSDHITIEYYKQIARILSSKLGRQPSQLELESFINAIGQL